MVPTAPYGGRGGGNLMAQKTVQTISGLFRIFAGADRQLCRRFSALAKASPHVQVVFRILLVG